MLPTQKNTTSHLLMPNDKDDWFKRIKDRNVPRKRQRCTKCFDMRFERSALYAYENGLDVFTSSSAYLGGKTWIKLIDRVTEPLMDMNICNTGYITGGKAAQAGCIK